jgi:hypothetical protein
MAILKRAQREILKGEDTFLVEGDVLNFCVFLFLDMVDIGPC